MTLHRRNPRRDANEAEIVAALECAGVHVFRLSGRGVPDLLCAHRGRWVPLEVKTRTGRLTEAQRGCPVPIPVVRSVADALAALGL